MTSWPWSPRRSLGGLLWKALSKVTWTWISDSDDQIARSLESRWAWIVAKRHNFPPGYLSSEEVGSLAEIQIEVIRVVRVSNMQAAVLVRTSVEVPEVPDVALSLLLATGVDKARSVLADRLSGYGRTLPPDIVPVFSNYALGKWNFVDSLSDKIVETSLETRVAIGEPIQLQTSWKEPPFAVTILGPTEVVDQFTVRVPARITAILPRWSFGDIGGSFLAMLCTRSDSHWEAISWDNNCEYDHRHPGSLHEDWESSVVLVKGGSHEGFLYFQSDDSNEDRSVPDEPFVDLQYLDETEQELVVDLTRNRPIPERVRFDDGRIGTLWDDPPVDGVGWRLSDSQWGELQSPPVAAIGDTVSVVDPDASEDSWFDFTVLEPPGVFDNHTLRIRLRITAKSEDDLECRYFDFQLSSGPDTFGRIRNLWKSERAWDVTSERPDSFTEITLSQGQTRDAFVYFSAPNGRDASDLDSLTLLWYGLRMFEMPIFLSDDVRVLP